VLMPFFTDKRKVIDSGRWLIFDILPTFKVVATDSKFKGLVLRSIAI